MCVWERIVHQFLVMSAAAAVAAVTKTTNDDEMRFELVRLATYVDWPTWNRACPTQLATAGFYYIGNDEIVCFCCKATIDCAASTTTRDVESEHLKRYPTCRRPLGEESGNVEIVTPTTTTTTTKETTALDQLYDILPGIRNVELRLLDDDDNNSSVPIPDRLVALGYGGGTRQRRSLESGRRRQITIPQTDDDVNCEYYRLLTFEVGWLDTSFAAPKELAENGFYFLGSPDRVKCAFCKGVLRDWRPGDRVSEEHARHFPHCRFVRGLDVGNISGRDPMENAITTTTTTTTTTRNSPSSLRVLMRRQPKHPEYAVELARIGSFKNWPKVDIQSPETLARAGFFYVGYSDMCKCFFCDIGLRNWEDPDDPWVQHARWSPECDYLKMCKGEDYISAIREEYMMDGSPPPPPPPPSKAPLGIEYVIDPREVRARMSTASVQAVIEAGFDEDIVQQTIKKRLQSHGDDFPNSDSMVAAINIEERQMRKTNDNNNNSPKDDWEWFGGASSRPPPPAVTPKEEEEGATIAASPPPAVTPKEEEEEGATIASLHEENRLMRERRLCKVCMDADANIVFLPCGHMVCCGVCTPPLTLCPICRKRINATVKTFLG